ncbi:HU family DNA-binding protein [Candidatus Nomurabacteria bacterium]|uniref:HU family DNA-binding protein n=1 Tax=candidate division WWE3 bacterium TaxID=2053526 RepID=A0A955DZX0_UNCKA|nr:HU family DNA-binding protein [candidate division WWE3 bacterium]MCB9824171.1 HU family DNA-binding protein [Candidatus Nomurabacteria bacterium]MCB9826858.1 HU family DNA-binding protein [Candidatus Nomurabacteria bacterium]MCB9828112.1 HU family DNA-binding protein [Candidatus Nomurabacteria bacterium]HXK52444.1 HU family DNA-binding protein [bacterium]
MSKQDIVNALAQQGMTKVEAARVLEALTTIITKALAKGEKVTLTGFGTFETRKRAARAGRNPQTGVVIQIPATRIAAFKAGKALRDAVRK